MKAIGKTKEGNLVSMTDEELRIIMFGTNYTNGLSQQQDYDWEHKMNIEIPIVPLFNKYRAFNNLKISGHYDSISAKLDSIKQIVEKVELEVLIEQEQLKK